MKALIAMSGGVDSSVAALLTKLRGFDCIGCTMKLYDGEGADLPGARTCCSLDDAEDARSVAIRLGIPYYVFNFKEEFREKVIDKFICSYERGLTPNPCVDCNRYLKFDKLYTRGKELGCEYVVTGHYARIVRDGDRFTLRKALDPAKDQSYFLYTLDQDQLAHTLFPLGELNKTEVRALAAENGFLNAEKPDSQDICFVPDGDYARVIRERTGREYPEGDYLSVDGRVLGRHRGIIRYTVGQRKGLGVSAPEPLYVCAIDPDRNTVTLGPKEALFRSETDAADFRWISGEVPKQPVTCKVKIRYRHREQPAVVIPTGEDSVHIRFAEPQRAITPGQAAVLYQDDVVLGGGMLI